MANATDIANVENYYADLLILQYRNKQKARDTIKLGADLYMGDGLVFDLNNILDIDTAVGPQLDLIGKILGCSRDIVGLTLDMKYFSFEKLNAYGYSDVDALSEGYWKSFYNSIGSVFTLRDEIYRPVLKFKALYNMRNGSMAYTYWMFHEIFGDEISITNNQDMTITYTYPTDCSAALKVVAYLGWLEPPIGIKKIIVNT